MITYQAVKLTCKVIKRLFIRKPKAPPIPTHSEMLIIMDRAQKRFDAKAKKHGAVVSSTITVKDFKPDELGTKEWPCGHMPSGFNTAWAEPERARAGEIIQFTTETFNYCPQCGKRRVDSWIEKREV